MEPLLNTCKGQAVTREKPRPRYAKILFTGDALRKPLRTTVSDITIQNATRIITFPIRCHDRFIEDVLSFVLLPALTPANCYRGGSVSAARRVIHSDADHAGGCYLP